MVCRAALAGLAGGWSVQSCYTKHGQQVFLTLLMDILLPGGDVARVSGCDDRVCDGCASLLNEVDECSHKLRAARQQIRDKYKMAALAAGDAAMAHQVVAAAARDVSGQKHEVALLEETDLMEQVAGSSPVQESPAKADELQPVEEASSASLRRATLRCPTCPRRLRTPALLASHAAKCRPPAVADVADVAADVAGGAIPADVEPQLSCHCGEQFGTAAQLTLHKRTRHWDATKYLCDVCNVQLKNPRAFVEHMRKHGETRPFRCDECDKRFTLASSLRTHRRLHTGDKPYQCELCGRAFSQHTSLQSHRRTHTNQRPHACDECDRTFRETHALKKHKLIHSGEKPYRCELCDQRFRQKGVLQRHIRTHTGERPYRCDQCDGAFIDSGALKMHKIQHTGQKPFYCEHCGKGFSDSFWFNKHKMYHSGERPFQCDVCPKAFTDARILRHHKKLHSGDRPYICYVCGARFSNSSHLTRHNHIHTGAKPFGCDVCRQTFRDKSTLKRHLKTHSCRKTLSCPDCARTFPRRDALLAHRREPCVDALALAVSAAGPPGFTHPEKPLYSLKPLQPELAADGAVLQLQPVQPTLPG
ncbi:zinc finger protein 2-like, partial [Pollicipes pollicipes]|uniref:zinc finger protein 2-like n=1 Tax=Pollicipes pollicipes TaxID=41117 RepID=UPI0018856F7A